MSLNVGNSTKKRMFISLKKVRLLFVNKFACSTGYNIANNSFLNAGFKVDKNLKNKYH